MEYVYYTTFYWGYRIITLEEFRKMTKEEQVYVIKVPKGQEPF